MCGLNRRDNSLHSGEIFKGADGLLIGDGKVFTAPGFSQLGMFRSNTRIIQTSGEGLDRCNLAFLIL